MTLHGHHDEHHIRLVDELEALETSRRGIRAGTDHAAWVERRWRLITMFTAHLRCCHGWRYPTGPPLSIGELREVHDRYHGYHV